MDPEITIDKRLVEIKPGSFIFEFPNALSTEICKDIIERQRSFFTRYNSYKLPCM